MSFFIKNKRKSNNNNAKFNAPVAKKKFKDEDEDDDVTSESDMDNGANGSETNEEDSDEDETAQEKRVRLAKVYLEEIKRLEAKDDDEVTQKLKEDYLKETGLFRDFVADKYLAPVKDNIRLLRHKGHKLSLTCVCVSADSKYCFSGSKDGGVIKWDLITQEKQVYHLSKKPITCLAVSEDFSYLAIGVSTNNILIYNPTVMKLIHTFEGHRGPITGVVFRKMSPVNLFSCSKDRSVKTWSMEELSYLETLYGHQGQITAIDALSKERAVTSGCDSSLHLWKIPEESQLIFNGSGNIDCVKFLNESHFISGGDAGELCVWSVMKKKPLCSVKNAHGTAPSGDANWITSVATFVNSDLVASGSCDGFIRLWKLEKNCRSVELLYAIPVEGFINGLTFSPDGQYLLAAVGQEHRNGRWTKVQVAKNGLCVVKLI